MVGYILCYYSRDRAAAATATLDTNKDCVEDDGECYGEKIQRKLFQNCDEPDKSGEEGVDQSNKCWGHWHCCCGGGNKSQQHGTLSQHIKTLNEFHSVLFLNSRRSPRLTTTQRCWYHVSEKAELCHHQLLLLKICCDTGEAGVSQEIWILMICWLIIQNIVLLCDNHFTRASSISTQLIHLSSVPLSHSTQSSVSDYHSTTSAVVSGPLLLSWSVSWRVESTCYKRSYFM